MKAFPLIFVLMSAILSCSTTSSSFSPENSILPRTDGSTINFYIGFNSTKDPAETLLLYMQGSDCNSVLHDEFLRNHAKAAWPSADVLTVEKRGITADFPYSAEGERPDCPAEHIQRDNPEQRVTDLLQVLNAVLQKRHYRHVIALGGSEGALIAAMMAAESDSVDAVVMINGGGRYFLDDVLHSIRSTTPAHTREEELDGFNGFANQILTGEPLDLEVSNHGYQWWRSMLTLDQQNILSSIQIPALIIQSSQDKSVSPWAAAAMITNLKALGKRNFDFRVYPDLDHGLNNAEGTSKADQVVNDVRDWLKRHIISP